MSTANEVIASVGMLGVGIVCEILMTWIAIKFP